MVFNKNDIVKDIRDRTIKSFKETDNINDINAEQLYFIIDKYLEVPSYSSSEPGVAIIQLYDDRVNDYSFTNIFLNFKDYLKDFFEFFPDVYSLFAEGNPNFVKWMILGKILMNICRMSKKSWGLNECLILHKIYTLDSNGYVEEEKVINEIVNEHSDIDKMNLYKAVNDLCQYGCTDLTDGLIKINKHVYLRGKRYD